MKASERQCDGSHYKDMVIQPTYFCEVNGLSATETLAIKYICRHRKKNGKIDIQKAIHCLELLIEWNYPESVALADFLVGNFVDEGEE